MLQRPAGAFSQVASSGHAGFGPQKLATLAAYALRRNLLDWLETFKVEKVCAARLVKQRELQAEVGHCCELLGARHPQTPAARTVLCRPYALPTAEGRTCSPWLLLRHW